MIRVDLNAAYIPADQKTFMLHPGKNYHLFGAFLNHGAVSSDLPNLELQNGRDPLGVANINTQIIRARALRDWLALSEDGRQQTEVRTQLADYADESTKRFHDYYREQLQDILWNLDKGTVLFVPNRDLGRLGFFCELEAPNMARVKFNGPGAAQNFLYTGRQVKNIKQVPMRLVPPEILEEKNRTSILTELDSELSERIFRLYYGTFAIENGTCQAEIEVPSENFRPADATVLSALANVLEDNLQKLEREELQPTEFLDSIFLAFDEAELQLHARLNSEGVVQIAARSVTPLLASVFLSLVGVASAQQILDETATRTLTIENSQCPEDDQYPRLIEERLFGIVDMLGEDQITLICDRVQELRERTGASTQAETIVE